MVKNWGQNPEIRTENLSHFNPFLDSVPRLLNCLSYILYSSLFNLLTTFLRHFNQLDVIFCGFGFCRLGKVNQYSDWDVQHAQVIFDLRPFFVTNTFDGFKFDHNSVSEVTDNEIRFPFTDIEAFIED